MASARIEYNLWHEAYQANWRPIWFGHMKNSFIFHENTNLICQIFLLADMDACAKIPEFT